MEEVEGKKKKDNTQRRPFVTATCLFAKSIHLQQAYRRRARLVSLARYTKPNPRPHFVVFVFVRSSTFFELLEKASGMRRKGRGRILQRAVWKRE